MVWDWARNGGQRGTCLDISASQVEQSDVLDLERPIAALEVLRCW